jgi:hypothetical protein
MVLVSTAAKQRRRPYRLASKPSPNTTNAWHGGAKPDSGCSFKGELRELLSDYGSIGVVWFLRNTPKAATDMPP